MMFLPITKLSADVDFIIFPHSAYLLQHYLKSCGNFLSVLSIANITPNCKNYFAIFGENEQIRPKC